MVRQTIMQAWRLVVRILVVTNLRQRQHQLLAVFRVVVAVAEVAAEPLARRQRFWCRAFSTVLFSR